VQIRVYYEDTDVGGIVYHSRYLNFCERARSEIFFQQERSPIPEPNSWFVVKNITAEFLKPAKLGDLLEIKTELLWHKKASVALRQRIFCNNSKIFTMDLTLVYIKNMKPHAISQESLDILKNMANY